MNISDAALRSVAFLGTMERGKFIPRATCFFVQIIEDQHRFDHLVTAEHVISGLLTRGQEIWLRVNLSNGGVHIGKLDADEFRYHPNSEQEPTDVAVCPIVLGLINEKTGEAVQMEVQSLALNGIGSLLPDDLFRKQYMGRGGEIAIVGLFRSHFGQNRNIPIVRIGNISMLPEEPVKTEYAQYVKAYLVEARSIAGLSGSPVFALPDLTLELAKGLLKAKGGIGIPFAQGAALLGLMHGHFDVPNLNEDVVTDENAPQRGIHTGIGVVIPVEKIIETVNHPELVSIRKKIVREHPERGATADLANDGVAGDDANQHHREGFTSLLNAAAKPRERDGQT